MFDIIRNKKGVALLMTIGILAIMSIIATSFALNMKLELDAAANYLRSVKALYLAESGINKVIADIRSQVPTSTYANVSAYVTNYDTTEQSVDSLGTYQVRIGREIGSADPNIGEDQKVNLNALDDTDSTRIGTLQTNGLTYDDIAKIIDYRDPDSAVTTQLYTTGGWVACAGNETNTKNSTFSSLEEVRLIIGDTKYNNIKKYITIYGPIIRGGLLAEYYNSISGSSPNVVIDKTSFVGKVIELGEVCQYHWSGDAPWNCMPGADGDWNGWLETHDAAWAGASLLSDPGGNRINYFGVIFEGYLEILPSEIGLVVTFYMRNDAGARLFIDGTLVVNAYYDKGMDPEISGTYTFNYPGWHPIKIDYYDQAEANGCALKWSLAGAADTSGTGNYIPAERLGFYPIVTHPKESGISYPSAGIYSITCVGKVKATDGTVLAEKKVTAAIKVFGTWAQTTKEEFYAAWFSDPGTQTGTYDSNKYFPGNYADGHVFNVTWLDTCPDNAGGDLEAGGYTTTVNALKLGYWDDFDEDLAYTVVNLTAMARKVIEGNNKQKKGWFLPGDVYWAAYRINKDPADTNYFALTFEKIQPYLGSCKVQVDVNTWTELYFEANYNYYRPDTNVFARAWTTCKKDGADREPMKRLGWRGNAANVILPADPAWAKVKYREAGDDSHYYYDLDDDGKEWRDINPKNGLQDTPIDVTGEVPDPSPVYRAYNNPSDSYPQNPQAASRVYIYTTWNPVNGWMSPALEDDICYSASGAYWQPPTTYLNASVFARGDREDPWDPLPGMIDSAGDGFYDVVIDRDQWEYSGSTPELNDDCLEIALVNYPVGGGRTWGSLSPDPYTVTNVLGMVKGSSSNNYKAYLGNGAKSLEYWPWTWPVYPNFKFKANNAYELTWIRYQAIWMRGAPLDTVTQYFDNARFIPDNGHLASTPFYAGENVTWGRLSFTEKNAADAQLDVAISLRTAADKASMMLLTGDTGWTSYANGAQITNTGRWLQYKATLTSIAFNKDNYANSGKTPIFQDITITYLPQVEVLYYREVTE